MNLLCEFKDLNVGDIVVFNKGSCWSGNGHWIKNDNYSILGFSNCLHSKQVSSRHKCCGVCNGYVDLKQDTTVIKMVCLGLSSAPYVIFDEVIKKHLFLDEFDTLLE